MIDLLWNKFLWHNQKSAPTPSNFWVRHCLYSGNLLCCGDHCGDGILNMCCGSIFKLINFAIKISYINFRLRLLLSVDCTHPYQNDYYFMYMFLCFPVDFGLNCLIGSRIGFWGLVGDGYTFCRTKIEGGNGRLSIFHLLDICIPFLTPWCFSCISLKLIKR